MVVEEMKGDGDLEEMKVTGNEGGKKNESGGIVRQDTGHEIVGQRQGTEFDIEETSEETVDDYEGVYARLRRGWGSIRWRCCCHRRS